MGLLYLS